MSKQNKKLNLPIFLLGTQRSGTTLLSRMLSAHSKLFVQNEIHLDRVFNKNVTDPIDAMVQEVTERNSFTLDEILSTKDITYWGVKDPQFTEHLDSIVRFKNDTYFILIIRDARAVVRSYIENKWGLGTNAYTGALRWKSEVEKQLNFMSEVKDKGLIISYESLVQKPEETLTKVCNFLGLEWDEAMLEYYKKKSFYGKKRENSETFKKPNSGNIDKWRTLLSVKQIQTVEAVCGELLERLEYPVNNSKQKISGYKKYWYLTHQKIIGEIQIQKKWRKAQFKDFIKTKRIR